MFLVLDIMLIVKELLIIASWHRDNFIPEGYIHITKQFIIKYKLRESNII